MRKRHPATTAATAATATAAAIHTPTAIDRIDRDYAPVQGRRSALCPGLNISAIASACGVSTGYLSNILKGRRRVGSDLALILAEVLGVTVAQVQGLYTGRERSRHVRGRSKAVAA